MSTVDDNQPATKGDVRAIVDAAERRIVLEIGGAVNAVAEQISANARVIDEKHLADTKIHERPPAAKKRASRRPGARL